MKFQYLTMMVKNLDASVRFYGELAELKVMRRFHPGKDDVEIAFMGSKEGETMLEFVCVKGAPAVSASGLDISFSAGDRLEELKKKAAELGCRTGEIVHMPPKPDFLRIYDPDGIAVEFTK